MLKKESLPNLAGNDHQDHRCFIPAFLHKGEMNDGYPARALGCRQCEAGHYGGTGDKLKMALSAIADEVWTHPATISGPT
ncbi:MAG: hypothetical protein V1766_00970 [Pseudomonadota bacterium]